MRCELIVDGQPKDKCQFVVPPQEGDLLEIRGQSYTVTRLRHNLDKNRLQLLCSEIPEPKRTTRTPRQEPKVPGGDKSDEQQVS